MKKNIKTNMVLYSVWSNCNNNCDFCLRRDRTILSKKQQLEKIDAIIDNINYIDWNDKFSAGISLLGGELYSITDKLLQDKFLNLIDVIIDKILRRSDKKICKYSSVTNGIYEPTFLYKVIDKIVDLVGIDKVDLNFSYDLKYRYKNDNDRLKALNNINAFHNRYDYNVGILMILTLYVIDLWKSKRFDINEFINSNFPNNQFCFLYPHKINTGKILNDFQFKRIDFIAFILYLRLANYDVYCAFMRSTKNSSLFKYSGCYTYNLTKDTHELPILADGKDDINDCGHSILYQCYSDTDKCMMCDLYAIDLDDLL